MSEMKNSICSCFADVMGRRPRETEVYTIAKSLPDDINNLANMWDWNDTEVRDKIYVWIDENMEEIY